ncbi:hypothetical protein [Macrococcus carouselicus]|uniref:Uncharacterized protein n=1 Tax=Macrococcus carouselicus TaxID=69969 RepID=A0A9Q8CKI8_9STAP|nr:hypothetical protein [Macrococcus carouselicus]TDM02304.1 hypothetical protein ERX40_07045 [Macrococcus carouselicus]
MHEALNLGADTTYTIYQFFRKDIDAYGDNWGHGSEIIYQAFDRKMQADVEKDFKPTGWKKISAEEISKYASDVVLFSSDAGKDMNSIVKSNV